MMKGEKKGEGEGTLCKGRELLGEIEGQELPWR